MPGSCCPPPCCPPVIIRNPAPKQQSQCCTFQMPPVNVVCEVPPPPRQPAPPKVCCIPVMICEDDGEHGHGGGHGHHGGGHGHHGGGHGHHGGGGCNQQRGSPSSCGSSSQAPICCVSMSCPQPQPSGGCGGGASGACGKKQRREKRWPQCNFLKPTIDTRIYRDGEHMTISYAGHIPGEQYISGRNLPTTTTFAKRRLCTFTPYEYVDPDGCCSFP